MKLQQIWLFSLCVLFVNCEQKLLEENIKPSSIPLHDLKFSFEMEEMERKSSAAYYYTFIGQYEKALESYELELEWGLDSLSQKDSLAFLNYKPVNAIDYLAERTKDEQVVIISEAHQKPSHRVFTRKMLAAFYANGFRHLGLETLTPSYDDSTKFLLDEALNSRGYPLNSPLTGTYTREPQMGSLVRAAIEIGFEVFGYERVESINGELERDLAQAINIERYRKAHPEGKILIHCGWYHAIESGRTKYETDNWMAYHLKQRTGVDPFTIYQDVLCEKRALAESPYYSLVEAEETSVLVNEKGELFGNEHFDVLLYHPRTRYTKNRPNWLLDIADNQFVPIRKKYLKGLNFPILVKAQVAKEGVNAVPMDIVELESVASETALVLPKGTYNIVLMSQDSASVRYEERVR